MKRKKQKMFMIKIYPLNFKVDRWITIYEPATIAFAGYGLGVYAPGLKEVGTAPYIVGHNLLKAHVRAYTVYQSDFKANQNGKWKPIAALYFKRPCIGSIFLAIFSYLSTSTVHETES